MFFRKVVETGPLGIIRVLLIVRTRRNRISLKVSGGTIFSGSSWGIRTRKLNLRKESLALGRKRAETPVST